MAGVVQLGKKLQDLGDGLEKRAAAEETSSLRRALYLGEGPLAEAI